MKFGRTRETINYIKIRKYSSTIKNKVMHQNEKIFRVRAL
jgi:hypothetical protein